MEMSDIVALFVNNGVAVAVIIYFMISAIAKCIFNLISKKVVRGGEPA